MNTANTVKLIMYAPEFEVLSPEQHFLDWFCNSTTAEHVVKIQLHKIPGDKMIKH